MTEIWKDIKGYEGYYQVSNLGNVKSLDRKLWNGFVFHEVKGKVMKVRTEKDGYLRCNLSKNGKMKDGRIHRLVAEAFIPNPKNKPTVNHNNTDVTDNSVTNLEWATHKEQVEHYNKIKNSL
jgi:hypothetical protein